MDSFTVYRKHWSKICQKCIYFQMNVFSFFKSWSCHMFRRGPRGRTFDKYLGHETQVDWGRRWRVADFARVCWNFARQWPLGAGRRPGDPRDPANPIMGAETADTRAAHSVQPSAALPPAQLEGASSPPSWHNPPPGCPSMPVIARW